MDESMFNQSELDRPSNALSQSLINSEPIGTQIGEKPDHHLAGQKVASSVGGGNKASSQGRALVGRLSSVSE